MFFFLAPGSRLVLLGMFWKVPPMTCPGGTRTSKPMSSPAISFARSAGSGSTSSCMSRVVISVPCEWPMITTFRPPL